MSAGRGAGRLWIALLGAAGCGLGIGAWAWWWGGASPPGPAAGGDACVTCHEEHVLLWRQGGHRSIACENCHGPSEKHVREEADPRPPMGSKGPDHCLHCHRRRPGEPEEPPRIDGFAEHLDYIEKRHVTKVDRDRVGGRCAFCHDPHLQE